MSNTFYESDDSDDVVCPLCCEPMDLSDQNFLPCPCGYRVCMWCWHRIKENYTNLCPACRSEYSDDPHAFAAVDKEEVIKNENSKKKRAKQKDADSASAQAAATAAREHQHALHLRHQHQHQQHMQHLHREQVQQQQGGRGGGGGGAGAVSNRRDLANMRVVQRNLVYATGLPAGLDTEEVLRRPENFGQYGKIYKIAISTSQGSEPRQGNVSAHITFAHKEDALACILATDGFWVDGRQLRSNFGTTKYCATYLRNAPCSNPDCLYLHELGDEEDRFTKEEIQQRSLLAPPIPPGAVTVSGAGGPSGTGKRCSSPFLPPPVYESPDNASGSGASAGGGGGGTSARGASPQVQQAASGLGANQRGSARAAKTGGQAVSTSAAPKPSASVGVAWGGAGAGNGHSAQPGERSAVGVVMNRRKGAGGAASPTASPHIPSHDAARLQEEWPSLADTAAPAPGPAPASAAQTSNRSSRNRRKKEKQQQQLLQQQQQQQQLQQQQLAAEDGSNGDDPSSPPGAPITPAQGPAAEATTLGAAETKTAASTTIVPALSQPPGLGPVADAQRLPLPDSSTSAAPAAPVSHHGHTARRSPPVDSMARTVSAGANGSTSTSMFSSPFFSNGGRATTEAAGPGTTAAAPPGFGELPSPSLTVPNVLPSSSSLPATSVRPLPPQEAVKAGVEASTESPPATSFFEEHFGGGVTSFNDGMFSSSAIGGGLFGTGPGAGMAASADVTGGDIVAHSAATGLPAILAANDLGQGVPSDRPSPARPDTQGSPLLRKEAGVSTSMGESLKRTTESDKGMISGGTDAFKPMLDTADGSLLFASSAPAPSPTVASPPGPTFGGGHFDGAFGSALFPVSSHRTRGSGDNGHGADLSVDPFANSSGALAAMLGVTLPPVDSQSSLASKMRSNVGDVRPGSGAQNTSPLPPHLAPRGGNGYGAFPREFVRGRDGLTHGNGSAREMGQDRGRGHRHDFQESSGHHAVEASRFSFAQDDDVGLSFSPARRSPQMGADPQGSAGGLGSPPHPGQHPGHAQHHHQSHAHRPFGSGRPLSPPALDYVTGGGDGAFAPPPHHHVSHSGQHFQRQQQQQQQQQPYSIQNGMAFLQKVLPGVQLSYGERHLSAGAGGAQGQAQQHAQQQGVVGAPPGSGVGWGDNAAGQRVDPAQAFGSSLWTMAPAPNVPRQSQGSRGGGYGAW